MRARIYGKKRVTIDGWTIHRVEKKKKEKMHGPRASSKPPVAKEDEQAAVATGKRAVLL